MNSKAFTVLVDSMTDGNRNGIRATWKRKSETTRIQTFAQNSEVKVRAVYFHVPLILMFWDAIDAEGCST